MQYWDMVVNEVVQEEGVQNPFSFTNVQLYKKRGKASADSPEKHVQKKRDKKKKYYLGASFPESYFTERELKTLVYLFHGSSTTQTAKAMSLSKRTIEYYIQNIKTKMQCRYVAELITKISASDVIGFIRQGMHEIDTIGASK